jgi:hypothetical protein
MQSCGLNSSCPGQGPVAGSCKHGNGINGGTSRLFE